MKNTEQRNYIKTNYEMLILDLNDIYDYVNSLVSRVEFGIDDDMVYVVCDEQNLYVNSSVNQYEELYDYLVIRSLSEALNSEFSLNGLMIDGHYRNNVIYDIIFNTAGFSIVMMLKRLVEIYGLRNLGNNNFKAVVLGKSLHLYRWLPIR